MAEQKQNPKTLVSGGPFRLSYPNLWEPSAAPGSNVLKYGAAFIFPKTNTKLKALIDAAVEAAKEEGKVSKWGGKIPPANKLKLTVYDGDVDKPGDPAYANSWYVQAGNVNKVPVTDKNFNPILEKDKVYAGCFVYASFNFFPYDNVSVGVSAGLRSVVFHKDGEALGYQANPEADFAGVEFEEAEDMSDIMG